MKICSVDGCGGRVNGRGYCSSHYNRLRRYGNPLAEVKRRGPASPEDRFWLYAKKTESCWIWTGNFYSNGYSRISVKRVDKLGHRWAYEHFIGPIPDGMQVDHICRVRACVRPDHLRLATNKQNNENHALRRDNTHGYRGVWLNKRTGKYQARAQHHGKNHYGGEYATPEEAAEAAMHLRLRLFTHNEIDRKGEGWPRTSGRSSA